ncbi:hypothetical protein V501_04316, partial [Pseudogymnoascus sp. VKM F-4519 (FW-2642)]
MAKPPSEPAHAPGGVQNGARPPAAAAGISSRGLLPQRRATSSSLLTKLLAPTYEVDESTADAAAVNADTAVGDDELLRQRTQRREQLLSRETKDMAAQTMRPLSPPQQTARYNLHDMNINHVNHVNALLHDHRAFLRSTRVRGNSLERTSREKMGATTASFAQRDVSGGTMTNPGDTGYTYTRPATDGEGIAPGDISERPPTEGFRAEYRSWRDGQRMPGAGMAWSIGDEALSPGEDGQVEKSITQALAGETHNSRSRKSSHSVRLFKEGLPEESARRSRLRDEKGAGGEGAGEAQMKGEEKLSPIAGSTEQTPAEDVSGSYFDLPIVEPTSTAPSTSRHHTVAGRMSRANTTGKSDESPRRPERQNTLPAQLLDDLRSRHNLTPAATKGSSFSNSIPITDSERQSTADLSISVPSDDSTAPATSGDEKPRTESPNSDEESSEEKISSALFVPHQSSREPGDESPQNTPPCREPLKDRRERGEEERWLVEHEVAPHEVEKEVSPAKLSPELVSPRSRTASGFFSQTSGNTLSSSDASYPSAKGEEQVPVTQEQGEDVDVTPTERRPSLQDYTVKTRERAPTQDSAQQQPSPKAAGPLEAIELIPYKHQVGGHTTLWRFSKRAVCKQLNNRENQFYETVEHYHPALLKFMPRYIGVLNVTFEKQLKRKPTLKNAGAAELIAAKATAAHNGTLPSALGDTNGIRPRVISQSLAAGPIPTPTVTFADNRHIIPKSFMQGGPIPLTETPYKSLSDSNIHVSPDHKTGRSTSEPVNGEERPTLSDRHAVSWGATTVNRKLRYEVFGEAFLRQPVQVQPHKKPGQHHLRRDLAHRAVPPVLRATTSDSNLNLGGREEEDVSLRMQAIKAAALRRGVDGGGSPTKVGRGVAIPVATGGVSAHGDGAAEGKGENGVLGDEEEFAEQIGTSAPEAETVAPVETPKGKKKRRYSSGGLRRRPEEGEKDRGSLKYFAEADDPGYTGDAEEDVFAMDPDVVLPATALQTTTSLPLLPVIQEPPHVVEQPVETGIIPTATDAPTPPPLPVLPRPANPKEAQTQTQPDSRVEYFLLLEDLTAGMRRPCIMDLKMGTRQYGVDADSAKQASQRRKCAATTSRALGVRVCGLQVWDRESQGYIFQDKYYGRDLTEGEGFRGALRRFLWDGKRGGEEELRRRVGRLLERIGRLEVLIGGLEGYRFYAASLLMFYDGASEEEVKAAEAAKAAAAAAAAAASAAANGAPSPPPPTVDPDQQQQPRKGRDIDFKIADFANCVTAENGG